MEGVITCGDLETWGEMAVDLSIGEMAFSWWPLIPPILVLERKLCLKPDKLKDNES